jgi:mRNA interferase RelE/StbE
MPMNYPINFKPKAIKDLQAIDLRDRARIFEKAEAMQDNLVGDVKKLTNFTPEYRLRVGNYRVLFEIEDNEIVVYRVRHRKDIYR